MRQLSHLMFQLVTQLTCSNMHNFTECLAAKDVLYDAAPWAPNLTSHQKKLLMTIQRKFLLFITGDHGTTPTTALQSITGILPLYLKVEQETVYVRVARLRW
ncbi:hypothetical protein AVEN_32094-1 [Araneus ventricosus]|uniref:Uncharacterized protein n=1 Tax=Araneus ventricosus TaxID=182803 RepID=A0A4Y2EEW8_ARAVE|nr:hypothetical protein AVEN_32094-1 [Araneus ventricosus]